MRPKRKIRTLSDVQNNPIEHSTLEVDVKAVCENWHRLDKASGAAETAAVVKADAYGLGADPIVPALCEYGVKTFFVANVFEGVQIREATKPFPERKIFVLNGFDLCAAPQFAKHNLIPVLNTIQEIQTFLAQTEIDSESPVAVQMDTGMNRLGLSRKEISELSQSKGSLERLNIILWMSHLACAEDPDHPLNKRQLDRFNSSLEKLPPAPASLANSAGIHLGSEYHFDVVRPGIALYGGSPSPGNRMQPVVRFAGKILQLRDVDEGETVGYGAEFRAERTSKIATVGAGYADGILRSLGNTSSLMIGSYAVPIVGRVSMDVLALDVTDLPPSYLREGDHVPLIDTQNLIDDVAKQADTISYEILTRLGARSKRIYTGR